MIYKLTQRSKSIVWSSHIVNKLLSHPRDSKRSIESIQTLQHTQSPSRNTTFLTHLKSRSVARLQGKDTVDLLQGLLTNDVNELVQGERSVQYSLMLNVQGRILYDVFIYNMTREDGSPCTLFVDLPAIAADDVIAILKRYKLRKKVDILNISDEYQVWSQFSSEADKNDILDDALDANTPENVISCPDPRVAGFGRRSIRRISTDENDTVDESVYKQSRYKWGLPEGVDDLPPGNCFPLESNAVFMNGVSFDKGCYIGQELTARTQHTGATRKRLMPLSFINCPAEIESGATIRNGKGRNAGKVRGQEGDCGLGLVRLAHVKDTLLVTAADKTEVSLTTHIPHWWPELEL